MNIKIINYISNCFRGNLSTYKELCSFASDLNQPDLIYKFMHLANHNAMWNSKKGLFHFFKRKLENNLLNRTVENL